MRKILLTLGCLLLGATAGAQPAPLKIVSYNIYEGMRLDTAPGKDAFAAWVRSVAPDILALQEVQRFTPQSLAELAARYGHPHAVLLKQDGYPLALTSRHPIENVQKVLENFHHGYIAAKIAGYHVVTVHLSPHKYRKRREEIDLLLGMIKAQPATERWILLGDFNNEARVDASRHDHAKVAEARRQAQQKFAVHDNLVDGKLDYEPIDRLLAAGFVDVVHTLATGDHVTRPTKSFLTKDHTAAQRRIDYIFTSPNITNVLAAGVLKDSFTDTYSDHYPVWMTLKP